MKQLDKTIQKNSDLIGETIGVIVSSTTLTLAAKKLGINRSTLYWRLEKYPEINEAISTIREQALNTLKIGSIRAAEVLVEYLDDYSKGLEASKEILDRIGIGKGPSAAQQLNDKVIPILGSITTNDPNDKKVD